MVLPTLQMNQIQIHLATKHIDPSRLAKLLLPHFSPIQLHRSIQVLLFLEYLQNSIYSQLQAIVYPATKHLLLLSLEKRKGRACENVYDALFEKVLLLWLEYLENLILPC